MGVTPFCDWLKGPRGSPISGAATTSRQQLPGTPGPSWCGPAHSALAALPPSQAPGANPRCGSPLLAAPTWGAQRWAAPLTGSGNMRKDETNDLFFKVLKVWMVKWNGFPSGSSWFATTVTSCDLVALSSHTPAETWLLVPAMRLLPLCGCPTYCFSWQECFYRLAHVKIPRIIEAYQGYNSNPNQVAVAPLPYSAPFVLGLTACPRSSTMKKSMFMVYSNPKKVEELYKLILHTYTEMIKHHQR